MMIKGGLEVSASNQSCSWGKYAAAAAATNTTIARKPQEDAVRQMITRSQLCLECALNLADSSWQEEILLTKSSSQNESSSLACDGSPVCVSLAPFLDEVPVNHTNRIVALDIPVFDAIVLESKIEEETECIISIECHHASGTEEQQEELVPPPHILLIHRPTETPQNSNFLIKKPDTPEDNFRKDRNKEERVETSCDNNVVRESQIKYKEEASFMLAVQSFESTVSTVRQIDVWRPNISTAHQAQADDTMIERTLSPDKLKGLLYTSSDVFSSEDVTMELLIESSLLTSGIDVKSAVINHGQDFYQKCESPPAATRLTYGVQNINARTAQYVQGFPFVRGESGFPFVKEKSSNPNIFSITLCPPHNLESVTPDNVEFDLGFRVLKSEKDNTAFVASVARHSPAAIVGIRPSDKIRFAFAHTLSSPFRASTSKFGSVSLLTHDSLDLSTSFAVYHAPEVESVQAAEYAMACFGDGATTTFEEFNLLFPFDVTKPLGAHSPASFKVGQDPILYPITVVFERSDSKSEDSSVIIDEVFGEVSESAEQVLGRVLSCFGGSQCVLQSPEDIHGAEGDNFVRPAPIFHNTALYIVAQLKQPNLMRRSAF
jgi:hypothetical protein